jgi:hypothetical protein
MAQTVWPTEQHKKEGQAHSLPLLTSRFRLGKDRVMLLLLGQRSLRGSALPVLLPGAEVTGELALL